MKHLTLFCLVGLSLAGSAAPVFSGELTRAGWLHWRGPQQNGTSRETGLPDGLAVGGPLQLWTADLAGQSTAVVAGGRLYIMGYAGEGAELQELVACLDAETGEKLWEQKFNDFLSDIIYTRYATASPTLDGETGNVYMQGSQGLFACFSGEGKILWQCSMMELYGRMTFPNGRTASPVVDGDLVITHHITANWGAHGPARDRFYAFDKKSGALVWSSTPGDQPKDSSYAPPTLAWWNGRRVLYCGTGDGAIVCINARTGDPLWRVKVCQGGLNTAILIHNSDKIITIHGTENLDTSEIGRMVALRLPAGQLPGAAAGEPVVFEMKDLELWRNELSAFTSSPILVGDRVYQVSETGDLCAVDARSGKVLWKHKLGIEQRNASLIHADGKLFVPMLDDPGVKTTGEGGARGALYVIQPGDSGCEVLSHLSLEGRCFGSPTVYNGKIYVQTTKKLYCFGRRGPNPGLPAETAGEPWPTPGPAAHLQIIPSEVLLHPGETASFRVRKLDANGFTVGEVSDPSAVQWRAYIPATAKVKAQMKGSFNSRGVLEAATDSVPSAGAFEATLEGCTGYIRGRVLPGLPLRADLEDLQINQVHPEGHPESGTAFGFPPLPWIGARFKFEVRERDGGKVLTKTIDNKLFQRGVVFLGDPEMNHYTIEADVLSDGTRRKMSEVGLINQRYAIVLKGNSQALEVNSNLERLRVSTPFPWRPGEWYHLKTRVDVAGDGSGIVRAKAWKKGDPEPDKWNLEVPHAHAHRSGSPGLFGFAPQDMKVYIDNISVSSNQ